MQDTAIVMYTNTFGIVAGLGIFWAVFTLFYTVTGSFRPRKRRTSR